MGCLAQPAEAAEMGDMASDGSHFALATRVSPVTGQQVAQADELFTQSCSSQSHFCSICQGMPCCHLKNTHVIANVAGWRLTAKLHAWREW